MKKAINKLTDILTYVLCGAIILIGAILVIAVIVAIVFLDAGVRLAWRIWCIKHWYVGAILLGLSLLCKFIVAFVIEYQKQKTKR